VEDGLREADVGHAEVGDRRPERRLLHRQADDEAEGEDAVDERPAELGALARFEVDVDRCRLQVAVLNQMLSLSVTVRRISCSNMCPITNSSNQRPAMELPSRPRRSGLASRPRLGMVHMCTIPT
jgi:hypothetical protein